MPFCYKFSHQDPIKKGCPEFIEEIRTLETRKIPAQCPNCGAAMPKGVDLVSFNTVFAGSERADRQAEIATQMSVEAQAEGFTSQDEMQAAEGYAQERAKQLGIPVERILGGTKSPFKGDPFVPDSSDAKIHEDLVKERIKAHSDNDQHALLRVAKTMKEHEAHLKKKAAKIKKKFEPDRSPDQCKKLVVKAQRERKMSV